MADIVALKLPDNNVYNVKDARVSKPVPADAVFTDHIYESKSAASGGTDVSLVTTGEKYTWNNKSSLALGETSSTAYRGDRGKTAYEHSQVTSGNPHNVTASDVGAIASTLKGSANGVAELDSSGKVPSSQLPSYVDDVLEYSAKSSFPTTGETGKIYVDTSTNLTYRWGGTEYVVISSSLALGETSSTAYRGDRGKIAYDHSQSTHARTDATAVASSTTNGNIKINGTETTVYTHPTATAKSSGLYKVTVDGTGHVTGATAVEKSDITGLGIPGSDTTYTNGNGISISGTTISAKVVAGNGLDVGSSGISMSQASTTAAGAMSSSDKTKLNGIETGAEVNQNAFSNVKVGSTTVAADTKTDTLELVAGSNVTLTPDATNDKVTIEATDTTYESKTAASGGTAVSLVTTGEKYTWNNKSSLALGETSSTAYRGDRGKTAYDHSQSTHARTDATAVAASSTNGNIKINGTETTVYTHPGSGTNPHGTTKSDVGLGNVGNFKAVSTVASQGLTTTEKANARANIGAGTSSFSGSYNDLSNKPSAFKDLSATVSLPASSWNRSTLKLSATLSGTTTSTQIKNVALSSGALADYLKVVSAEISASNTITFTADSLPAANIIALVTYA